jgi:hypothetical protein
MSIFSLNPIVSFLTSPAFGSFSRGLPGRRGLPVAYARFVRFSASFVWRTQLFILNPARVVHTVLIRSSNQSPLWQLRFIQARNLPELLDSTWSGFLSPLAARPSFAFGARERTRGTGEFCLRHPAFRLALRGAGSISLTRLFPGYPGLSWKRTFEVVDVVVLAVVAEDEGGRH